MGHGRPPTSRAVSSVCSDSRRSRRLRNADRGCRGSHARACGSRWTRISSQIIGVASRGSPHRLCCNVIAEAETLGLRPWATGSTAGVAPRDGTAPAFGCPLVQREPAQPVCRYGAHRPGSGDRQKSSGTTLGAMPRPSVPSRAAVSTLFGTGTNGSMWLTPGPPPRPVLGIGCGTRAAGRAD